MSESVKKGSAGTNPPPRRDAARSRRAILLSALKEFSKNGHAGARMDVIAEKAGVSKPMIYSYFGDKDQLYKAALREAYVQIRAGERQLDLEHLRPDEAIRSLAAFTQRHFISKPWFISMLNTENLLGGGAVRSMADLGGIQSPLIEQLRQVLESGAAEGLFRADVDPVDFYICIAALCYFPVSNRHTLSTVFAKDLNSGWFEAREEMVGDMLLAYLRPAGGGAADADELGSSLE